MKKSIALAVITAVMLGVFTVPAFAQDGAETDQNVLQAAQLTCMAAAVDKREVAILTVVDTQYNAVKTALTARQAALKLAWVISDRSQRKEAVKAAWKAFHGTWRVSNKQLQKDKRAAWKVFNVDRKLCGNVANDEPKGEN
ncbi:MAG: hypothetical protein AAB606_00625 [Patescibacteria group bacterium]